MGHFSHRPLRNGEEQGNQAHPELGRTPPPNRLAPSLPAHDRRNPEEPSVHGLSGQPAKQFRSPLSATWIPPSVPRRRSLQLSIAFPRLHRTVLLAPVPPRSCRALPVPAESGIAALQQQRWREGDTAAPFHAGQVRKPSVPIPLTCSFSAMLDRAPGQSPHRPGLCNFPPAGSVRGRRERYLDAHTVIGGVWTATRTALVRLSRGSTATWETLRYAPCEVGSRCWGFISRYEMGRL